MHHVDKMSYLCTFDKHFFNDPLLITAASWQTENMKTSFFHTVLVSLNVFGMIDVLNTLGLNASLYYTSTHHRGKKQAGLWDVMRTQAWTILMSFCHTDWWQQPWTERVAPTDTQTESRFTPKWSRISLIWTIPLWFSNRLTLKEGLESYRDQKITETDSFHFRL